MGATIGVTLMGVIVNHGLPAAAAVAEGGPIHRLPPVLRAQLAAAIRPAFFAAMLVALLVWVIAVVWVTEVPLRRSVEETAATPAPESGPLR